MHAQIVGQTVNGNGSGGVSPLQAALVAMAAEFWPGLIASIAIASTAYLAIHGQVIPEIIQGLDLAIVAFFFGARGSGPLRVNHP